MGIDPAIAQVLGMSMNYKQRQQEFETQQKQQAGPAKARVRQFMIQDAPTCEHATELAESTAAHFGIDYVGGPLDDETHWIWEIAMQEWEKCHGPVI